MTAPLTDAELAALRAEVEQARYNRTMFDRMADAETVDRLLSERAALKDEIDTLREEVAAVTRERDGLLGLGLLEFR